MKSALVVLIVILSLIAPPAGRCYDGSNAPARFPFDLSLLPGDMTILLLGVDAGDKKGRARSDTMMLVRVGAMRPEIAVVSIPRDSRVNIKGRPNKINAAYAIGGAALACKTVRSAFGAPVDRYVVIDKSGLKRIFELIGLVEVVVDKPMRYRDCTGRLNINLQRGRQTLTPEQVEQFVRFRQDREADIGRIRRQQLLLKAAMEKLCQPAALFRAPQLVANGLRCVKTNLSWSEVLALASLAFQSRPENVVTASLPGRAASIGRVSYWLVDNSRARAIVQRMFKRERGAWS
ncbi:MAG TPA: LCP family protein [Candidatus Obscuribacterales bacterium]